MFGLTGGASLLCALLFWRLRWYRTATWAAAVLWLGVALLMLLGVGETGGGGGPLPPGGVLLPILRCSPRLVRWAQA